MIISIFSIVTYFYISNNIRTDLSSEWSFRSSVDRCVIIKTHCPQMFFSTFQGNRHVSISPAVVSNFVTLEKLTKLLDTVNTHTVHKKVWLWRKQC